MARPETLTPARVISEAISDAVPWPSLAMTARTTSVVTSGGVARPLAPRERGRRRRTGAAAEPAAAGVRRRGRGSASADDALSNRSMAP